MPVRPERCSHSGSSQSPKMPERRSSFSPNKRRSSDGRFRTTPNRSSGVRTSFNSRLGANGPAESACQKFEEQSPISVRALKEVSLKLANLSTESAPEVPLRNSLNDRLLKVRRVENGNLSQEGTECVTSSETPDRIPAEEKPLDEIISRHIKEEDKSDCLPAEHHGVLSGQLSEAMAKRDHLGHLKNQEVKTPNGTFESVIREESVAEVRDASSDSPPRPREKDRKYLRHSDIHQPRRSESPQCRAEKISRRDFPLSFGSGSKRSFYDCDVVDEVEKYFNKRFYLSCRNDWKVPEPCEVFTAKPWEVKELLQCKDRLNAVKEKLNDLNLKEWHAHTKKRNKAGLIVWKLRKTINPEFPTQAWCKFYENVCTFDLVPEKAKQDKMLNSVHLCEAPGAFITSLNHYIKTNFDDDFQWNWLGTTLNPHYEGNPLSLMINEDRFILHTLDHWTFGNDQTGDLMTPPNVADLRDEAGKLGEVLLVTADGSIDCQDDPGEQENYVAWLHYCEAFSAMMVLAEGGNFLLKMFTMFEHMTVSLLYLLSCVFEEVIVNKPATSKEGNSETYVVCKNFEGKDKLKPLLSGLNQNYGPNHPRKALFPRESIPEEFVKSVIECADTFRKYQSDIIEANLKWFKHPSEQEIRRNESIRKAVSDEFFRRYRLKELPDQYDIVGRHLINKMETYNMDPRLEVGSFSDRLRRAEVSDRQKMLDMKEDIERLDRQVLDQWPADKDIWWHKFDCEPGYNLSKDMQIATGKPVKRINSSKFCLGRLLDIRNKVREIILESKAVNLPSLNSTSEQTLKVPNATSVLDFKNALWASSDAGLNSEQEYKAFNKIIEEFDRLSRDDNLLIYGYPLLTQFNVGLVYLLAHSFERMALTRPRGQNFSVIFEKHDVSNRKFKVKRELDEISETIQTGSAHGSTVLAMLPIQKLCSGDFYKYITMANNICVKEQVLELIEEYLKATECSEEREKRRRTIA